jgi:hypothetical protein
MDSQTPTNFESMEDIEYGEDMEVESDMEDDDDDEHTDISAILSQFFIEPKKQRNVTEALYDIKKQMEIQNKLLAQIYMSLSSKV